MDINSDIAYCNVLSAENHFHIEDQGTALTDISKI